MEENRLPYETLKIGDTEYKLKISAASSIEIEKKTGKSLVAGMADFDKLETVTLYLWGALNRFQANIDIRKAQEIYDDYIDAGDMLADVLGIENVYAGCIDANQDKCIGVYASRNTYPKKISIGGKPCTKTHEKHISVLIHWLDNPTTAESAANEILDKLTDVHGCYTAGKHTVGFLSCSEAHLRQ
ncbi:MAG: hypothetical protein J6L61_05330 [Ruminiclostridium sp.]|nr:hypothetical protein [Ruminiclostridium sp.]